MECMVFTLTMQTDKRPRRKLAKSTGPVPVPSVIEVCVAK